MSKPKNHHYVPVHVQAAFASNEKGQVSCFDKHTKKSFITSPTNVLSESYFHGFPIEYEGKEFLASYEDYFAEIESRYQPALKAVVEGSKLSEIGDEGIAQLILYTAFQRIRTKASRDQQEAIRLEFIRQIKEKTPSGFNPSELSELAEFSEAETKYHHLNIIRDLVPELMKSLARRIPILMEAPKNKEFYLGDNPVVLTNTKNPDGVRSTLGWDSVGIEIYVPISPQRLLGFLCPTIYRELRGQYETMTKNLLKIAMSIDADHRSHFEKHRLDVLEALGPIRSVIDELEDRYCPEITPENLDFFNSLQVSWSSRYVIAKNGDFALAEKILREHPAARHPITQRGSVGKRPKRPFVVPRAKQK